MALKGELADLSLAELIEFFCNQRRTGRLTVSYPHAPAYFYLESGTVVHASIGLLRGIEAVYYALTQSNASFDFSTAYEAPCQTINQPWTSVVLEGLRRMDEGIKPRNPFPEKTEPVIQKAAAKASEANVVNLPIGAAPPATVELASAFETYSIVAPVPEQPQAVQTKRENEQPPLVPPAAVQLTPNPAASVVEHATQNPVANPLSEPRVGDAADLGAERQTSDEESSPREPAPQVSHVFLSTTLHSSNFTYGPWKVAAIFAALILIIAAVAVPWGWYARGKAARVVEQQAKTSSESGTPTLQSAPDTETASPSSSQPQSPAEASVTDSDAVDDARREREARARDEARLRAKVAETNAASTTTQAAAPSPASTTSASPATSGARKVVVQVTYDENGRVTQASGNDPTALRIARQKRFPPGKAGSATITIPIN